MNAAMIQDIVTHIEFLGGSLALLTEDLRNTTSMSTQEEQKDQVLNQLCVCISLHNVSISEKCKHNVNIPVACSHNVSIIVQCQHNVSIVLRMYT